MPPSAEPRASGAPSGPPSGPPRGQRSALLLGAFTAAAALAYSPGLPAAASKTPALLLVGLAALGATVPRLLGPGGARRLELSRPVIAWLGLCGGFGLSTIWATHSGAGPVAAWVGALALAVAACALPRAEVADAARIAATTIGGASSLVCLAQWLGGSRGLGLHGGQGNPNWLGLLLAATLPLQLDLLLRLDHQRRRWRLLPAASIALSLGALALSASRVAMVALAIATVLFAAPRWRKIAVPAVTLVAAGVALASPSVAEAWTGRWWIWRVTWQAAVDALPLGAGAGGFAHTFLDTQGELLARLPTELAAAKFTNATTAHNDWLEALATAGPLGLGLLAGALGLAAWDLRRDFRAGAAAATVAGLAALGDSPLAQPGVVALLALLLASAPRTSLRPRQRGAFMGAYALTLGATVVLLPGSVSRWMGLRTLGRAEGVAATERAGWLEMAHRQCPSSGEISLAAGLSRLELGDPARALPWLEHSKRHLANLGTDLALGNAWLELGRADHAVEAYRRALDRHPAYFRAHANLVEAYRQLGRFDRAEQHLRIARDLQPGHPKLTRLAERLRRAKIEADTQ